MILAEIAREASEGEGVTDAKEKGAAREGTQTSRMWDINISWS